MSEPKPKMGPFYGAAFGFNTDRRVKPVHFATGFFVALFGRQYRTKLLNNVVAVNDGKDPVDDYALPALHSLLAADKILADGIDQQALHALRKHLRCIANNDEAVFPIYGVKEFGCDYSTASQHILTSTRDNDGFAGYFVHSVLEATNEGKAILELANGWMTQDDAPLRRVFEPLLSDDAQDIDAAGKYSAKLGEMSVKRIKQVAKRMSSQTTAILTLCRNADKLVASETKIRFLVVGLCLWLFRYLFQETQAPGADGVLLLADVTGDSASRVRAQSRWSYARGRETIATAFSRFSEDGRFEDCELAWQYVLKDLNGRPKFEEFYRELAVRSGLAQPRSSRVTAKHFEPQPDTLRILILSVLPVEHGVITLEEALERLFNTWSVVFGGRDADADLLSQRGYSGLDQDRDIVPNAAALVELLSDLGLATRYSDGLTVCHSQP
jgi:hypothetical protein